MLFWTFPKFIILVQQQKNDHVYVGIRFLVIDRTNAFYNRNLDNLKNEAR